MLKTRNFSNRLFFLKSLQILKSPKTCNFSEKVKTSQITDLRINSQITQNTQSPKIACFLKSHTFSQITENTQFAHSQIAHILKSQYSQIAKEVGARMHWF